MGYSARYHAASLAAVFLALAIGILIGVGFGKDIIRGTEKSLEKSLKGDLENARSEADALSRRLEQEREFDQRAYPALVRNRLGGARVAIVGLGGLPSNLSSNIEQALAPTGARLVEVSVVREPPSLDALSTALKGTPYSRLARRPGRLGAYARNAGRQLINGGALLRASRDQLLSRASGQGGHVDDVILVRSPPGNLDSADHDALGRLESGLIAGVRSTRVAAVGVERSDAESSEVGFFHSKQIPTVDSLDLVSGQVAMVFALLGAEGNFGIKSTADRLLPDLLVRSREKPKRSAR